MAYEKLNTTGDGATAVFNFPFPYLDQAHVNVAVDGTPAAFTFSSASIVALSEAPADGAAVTIYRTTPSEPLVDFTDGSTLTGDLLDTATLQALYRLEEAYDDLGEDFAALAGNPYLDAYEGALE